MVEVYSSKEPLYWDKLCSLTKENPDRIFISNAKSKWITRLRAVDACYVYNVWHINILDSLDFSVGNSSVNFDEFIAYLEENHPTDLEWILWHPEIFRGEIDLD